MLTTLCRRLREQHNIELKIADPVKELLIEHGSKPEYRARELGRTVERLLEAKVAEKLLGHEILSTMVIWRAKRVNDAIEIEVCQG